MSKTGAPRKALNLNALRAQQADARGEKYLHFDLTPEGSEEPLSFRVLRRTWWPVNFLISVDQLKGDVDILRALMGEEQFDLACEAGLDMTDMKAIFKEVMGRDGEDGEDETDGASLGESSGSSES
ncbi:hypothetical protein V2S66_03295 [Streptomyces sp. V4-01]|uniref:Tail assembly chaperone n=1 Tax=Actinacidiphila polyblastidii TaxID=3110430 RepID=A0ABU7P5A3_9ACTN|nr:hypothetical protein [Streptomyces sp. V4-01]